MKEADVSKAEGPGRPSREHRESKWLGVFGGCAFLRSFLFLSIVLNHQGGQCFTEAEGPDRPSGEQHSDL